jgi:hypothetical protein
MPLGGSTKAGRRKLGIPRRHFLVAVKSYELILDTPLSTKIDTVGLVNASGLNGFLI